MLCTKCHQKEATIHVTTIVNGAQRTYDFCPDCAPDTGLDFNPWDAESLKAIPLIGKKCEFCSADAVSGERRTGGGAIHWCFNCGMELGALISESLLLERPDLLQQGEEESALLSFPPDAELQAWLAVAIEKAAVTLKTRKRSEG
jgi:hypothetical protein